MRSISSRHNPLVARYRAAAQGDADGLLLLDGAHLLQDALDAHLVVEHVFVAADASSAAPLEPLIARLRDGRTEVDAATASVMAAVSPVRSPSAVVALARRPVPGAGLFSAAGAFVIVACEVQDPGNLGAIARVAEAAGATGLVTAGRGADPYGWKALRGSMGSLLRLPVEAAASADAALRRAREAGCPTIAAVPRNGRPLFDVPFDGSVAILIGGEGAGLPDAVANAADQRITIPMKAPVESLNAAVSAALIAYEIRRQRG